MVNCGRRLMFLTYPIWRGWLDSARAGFADDELIAAAILHDIVEDTEVTIADLETQFSPAVIEAVIASTEEKEDPTGARFPWRARKEKHLAQMRMASHAARAITLADKLHNLGATWFDLQENPRALEKFSATPAEWLWLPPRNGDSGQRD